MLIFLGLIGRSRLYRCFSLGRIYSGPQSSQMWNFFPHFLYTGDDPTWTKIRLGGWDGYICIYCNKDMQVGYIYYIYSLGFWQSTVEMELP